MDVSTMVLVENNIQKANQLIYHPYSSFPEYNQARNLLKECQKLGDASDYRIENMLGKIDLLTVRLLGQYEMVQDQANLLESAKKHFLKTIELNPRSNSPYYGLCKTAILQNNFKEALRLLRTYQERETRPSNFSLMEHLLCILVGKETHFEPSKGNYIHATKVFYPPLLSNFRLAEKAAYEHDYSKMSKHLVICDSLTNLKNFNVDFSYLLVLSNCVIQKQNIQVREHLIATYASIGDIATRMMIAQRLLKMDNGDIESHFLFMDAYLDLKVYSPLVEECANVRQLNPNKQQLETLSLYEKLILERKVEEEQMTTIDRILKQGEELEKSGEYIRAIELYKEGYQEIGFQYFLIRVATLYSKMENCESAILYAQKYQENGYFYYVQAATILYKNLYFSKRIEEATNVAMDCYEKARMQQRGYSLQEWLNQLESSCKGGGSSSKVYQKKS